MKRSIRVATGLAMLLLAAAAPGQGPPEDPLARLLFPPDEVLRRGREIELSAEQRQTLRREVQEAQARAVGHQMDLQAESEDLFSLLEAPIVEEAVVLARLDRMLALEREIKRTHLTLMVRVRNLLSAAQVAKLRALRRAERGGSGQ